MMRALKLELNRGPAGVSNVGRFDVSNGSLGDIVNLRFYLQLY